MKTGYPTLVVVLLAVAAGAYAAEPTGKKAAVDNAPRLTLGKAFACSDYGGNKVCLVDSSVYLLGLKGDPAKFEILR